MPSAGGVPTQPAVGPVQSAGATSPAGGEPLLSTERVLLLEHNGAAAGAARAFVRDVSASWALPRRTCDDALEITSELVANAVTYSRRGPQLTLSRSPGLLTIAVDDDSTRAPVLGEAGGLLAESGRGLLIIDHLAEAWGHVGRSGGKVVWATLALPDG